MRVIGVNVATKSLLTLFTSKTPAHPSTVTVILGLLGIEILSACNIGASELFRQFFLCSFYYVVEFFLDVFV